jgi:hypothetical protein
MYVKFTQQDGQWTHLMEAAQVSIKTMVIRKKDVEGETGQAIGDTKRVTHSILLKEGLYDEIGKSGVREDLYSFGAILVDFMDEDGRIFDRIISTQGKVYLMNDNGKTLDSFTVPVCTVLEEELT